MILIRFPGNARQALARAIVALVRERGTALAGSFAVVQPGHVRLSRKPSGRV